MRRLLIATILGLALTPASASAVTLTAPPGGHSLPTYLQRWANASRVPTWPGTVTVIIAGCPGREEPACARSDGPTLWINTALITEKRRYVFMHELGHIYDYGVLTDADRRAFQRLARAPGIWRSDRANSPHERFAEAYGLCARYRTPPVVEEEAAPLVDGAYRYTPTLTRHRRICALIRAIGRR